MHWLQTLDTELFRFINLTLINPVFDVVMPFASGNALFAPLLLLAGVLLLWKGRARGALCVLMLALIVPLGDGLVCNTLKHAVGRPRPDDRPARRPSPGQQRRLRRACRPPGIAPGGTGRAGSRRQERRASMPSSHAANWFAATMILFIYYRRSVWFMLPAAILVSFSRIYNGVALSERRAGGRHPRRGLRRRRGLVPERALAMGRAKVVSALVAEAAVPARPIRAQPNRTRRTEAPPSGSPLRMPPWTSIGSASATSGLRLACWPGWPTSPAGPFNSARTKPTNGSGPNTWRSPTTANRR